MSEIPLGVAVFGPCVAMLPESQFSLIFPVRRSTVEAFDLDAIETAAKVCLYDNLPAGRKVSAEVPIHIEWAAQEVGGPMAARMTLVRLLATLEEE